MTMSECYIFGICTAYEQGVGKGQEGRITIDDNPYCPNSNNEYEAWGYGYKQGESMRKGKDVLTAEFGGE